LNFADLLDPKTGKSRVRLVDIQTPSYKVAREYMIRLEKEDLDDPEKLRLLAEAASSQTQRCSPEDFRARFLRLVNG
jgi:6-phosphofructokinase 1